MIHEINIISNLKCDDAFYCIKHPVFCKGHTKFCQLVHKTMSLQWNSSFKTFKTKFRICLCNTRWSGWICNLKLWSRVTPNPRVCTHFLSTYYTSKFCVKSFLVNFSITRLLYVLEEQHHAPLQPSLQKICQRGGKITLGATDARGEIAAQCS